MNGTKKWWESKTLWGSIIAILAAVVQIFGYQITPEMQQQLLSQITAVTAGIGGLIAMYGRLKASKKIG